jgi:hypothetical protein
MEMKNEEEEEEEEYIALCPGVQESRIDADFAG